MEHDEFPSDIKDQIIEMEKHKWIESEKANRDIGKYAYLDWIEKYAGKWRDEYNERKRQK